MTVYVQYNCNVMTLYTYYMTFGVALFVDTRLQSDMYYLSLRHVLVLLLECRSKLIGIMS